MFKRDGAWQYIRVTNIQLKVTSQQSPCKSVCERLLYDTLFLGLKSFKTLSDSWWTKNRFIGEKKKQKPDISFHPALKSPNESLAWIWHLLLFPFWRTQTSVWRHTPCQRGKGVSGTSGRTHSSENNSIVHFQGVCLPQSLWMTNVVFKCWHSWRKGGMLTNRAVGNNNRRFALTKTISLTSLSGSWR